MEITPETRVRDIAVELPASIPVLERLNIDYCCGGKTRWRRPARNAI